MALSLSLAAANPTALVRHDAALRCGTIDLRITSDNAPHVLAPVSQTLTRRVGTTRVQIPLERSGIVPVDGHRVRNRFVSSWTCLTGRDRQHYVLVGYACAIDPGYRNDCGGEKEWMRVLNERGRFIDAGVPQGGAARDRFNARIGIADALAAGVAMTSVLD